MRVVALAPPGVETPLLRNEFAVELEGQKGMPVDALARQAIAGIEAGRLEIRPGPSKVPNAMSAAPDVSNHGAQHIETGRVRPEPVVYAPMLMATLPKWLPPSARYA